MSLKLLHGSQTYDITKACTSCQLVSQWKNGADKLTFKFINQNIEVENGDFVQFTYDDRTMFEGIVFTNEEGINKETSVTCYDQRRYLKAKDTIMRGNVTLTSFIKSCASNMNVQVGELTDSVVNLDKKLFENTTYLDMIYDSINDNLLFNGYYYCLRNDGGKLTLKELSELRLPLVIGDRSIAYNFNYKRSIDSDTYNKVKLAKDNKSTGLRDVFIVEDSTKYGTWGMLQYFEKVDSNLNDSQIKERAKLLLKVKNKETQTLQVNAIGNSSVMGGNSVMVRLSDLGLDKWAIVNKVTHDFSNQYTMTLDLVFE